MPTHSCQEISGANLAALLPIARGLHASRRAIALGLFGVIALAEPGRAFLLAIFLRLK